MYDLSTLADSFERLCANAARQSYYSMRAYGGERMCVQIRASKIAQMHNDAQCTVQMQLCKKAQKQWQCVELYGEDLAPKAMDTMKTQLEESIKSAPLGPDPRPAYDFSQAPESNKPHYHKDIALSTQAVVLHRGLEWQKSVTRYGLECDAQFLWENGAFKWDQSPLIFAYYDGMRKFCEPGTVIGETLFVYHPDLSFFKRPWHWRTDNRTYFPSTEWDKFLDTVQKQAHQTCTELTAQPGQQIIFSAFAVSQLLRHTMLNLPQTDSEALVLHQDLILLNDFSHPLHNACRYDEKGLPRVAQKHLAPGTPTGSRMQNLDFPCLLSAKDRVLEEITPQNIGAAEVCCDFMQCFPDRIVCNYGLWSKDRVFAPCILPLTPLEILLRSEPAGLAQNIGGVVITPLRLSL